MGKTLWLWGEGGYYWLDFGEWGLPSPPSGKRAWEAFIDFAPIEAIQGLYTSLRKQCEASGATDTNLSAAMAEFRAKVPSFQQLQLRTLGGLLQSGLREKMTGGIGGLN